jgi:sec-independent protein translocase protein TatA
MPNIGAPELLLVLAIVILIFGASRIPKLGRSMGQSIRGFKQGLKEDVADEDEEGAAKKVDATAAKTDEK